ncbi:hypothetical protein IKE87_01935 [Candidatus Saccharibacteria bacterium]|nr:hypothetical protein [Candidatus Saccharibacteria bacterium]
MKKMKIASIVTLVVGLAVLVAGGVFFIIKQNEASKAGDADYLVEMGDFVMEDSDGAVAWKFTEVGKGTLTTNNHTNDYDFQWAIEDDKMRIRTDWLYEMDNEYTYEVNQGAKTLTLTNGDETYKFVANRE